MPTIPSFLAKHSEWIYRTLVLAGVCAVLWLNSKYVTRDEFDTRMVRVENSIVAMNTTLLLIQEQNKVNERQDATLRDFELRLRIIEQRGIK